MSMTIELSVYEALTDVGVKPDAARRVERQIESAIASGQEAMRREMTDQLMTKADGAGLKADLQKGIAEMQKSIADMQKSLTDVQNGITDLTWKLVTFVVAANGMMMLAASKLIT